MSVRVFSIWRIVCRVSEPCGPMGYTPKLGPSYRGLRPAGARQGTTAARGPLDRELILRCSWPSLVRSCLWPSLVACRLAELTRKRAVKE